MKEYQETNKDKLIEYRGANKEHKKEYDHTNKDKNNRRRRELRLEKKQLKTESKTE